eukprot:803652-Pelagomonas_calceolata.AAC.5
MTRMAAIAAEQPAEAKVQTHADLRHNKGLDEALQCVIHSCTIEHGRSGPKFKQAPHASQVRDLIHMQARSGAAGGGYAHGCCRGSPQARHGGCTQQLAAGEAGSCKVLRIYCEQAAHKRAMKAAHSNWQQHHAACEAGSCNRRMIHTAHMTAIMQIITLHTAQSSPWPEPPLKWH